MSVNDKIAKKILASSVMGFFFSFRLICLLKTLLSHMHFIKLPFILASLHRCASFGSGSYQFRNKSNRSWRVQQYGKQKSMYHMKMVKLMCHQQISAWNCRGHFTQTIIITITNHVVCVCARTSSLCPFTLGLVVSGQLSVAVSFETEQNHVFDTYLQLFPSTGFLFGSILPDLSFVISNHVSNWI